jgi:co-chaperonin GroES (HSP10)
MKVTGKIRPLRDTVFVTDMVFDEQRTNSGIILQNDDGKSHGIRPRWGRVWAVGSEQKTVAIGEWILVEHGRWTRTVTVDTDSGDTIEVRMVDNDAIMMTADELPTGTV